MKNNHYVVIMAGGKGSRLWPISRNNQPKQLQKLIGKDTMIQDTYNRIKKIVSSSHIYISTNDKYAKIIKKQLPKIPNRNYIIEPCAKNTAPAIGLVTAKIYAHNKNAIVTTVAADHLVLKTNNFIKSIKACKKFIDKHPAMLGVVGINPTFPATGYGYIEKGNAIAKDGKINIFKVKQFVEKPNSAKAKQYTKSSNFYWNASYFTFHCHHMLENFKNYEPMIYKKLTDIQQHIGKMSEYKSITKNFHQMPELAFDYIVEKLKEVFVISSDLGWDDVGSWQVIQEIVSHINKTNNVTRGNHISIDDSGSLIYAQKKLIATIGLKDIIVVDTKDATLICDKHHSQDVKKIVEILEKNKKFNRYL